MSTVGDIWLIVIGALGFAAFALLFVSSLVWVHHDTKARGRAGSLWLLIMLFTWPLGLLIYTLLRGRSALEEVRETKETTITRNDRLWAALSWIPLSPFWPITPILALAIRDTRNRPFIRYNALLSVITGGIIILLMIALGLAALAYFTFFAQDYQGATITIPLPLLFLPFFYWAYRALQGETAQVPLLSNWLKRCGWVGKWSRQHTVEQE